MGSIRKPEAIAKLTKLTTTTLSLPASTLNIGAQQYNTITALTLNTATIGVGGVDATLVAGSLYTVYAVISSGQVYLIASLNSSLPSGFTQARAVGGFTLNSSSQIDQVASQAGDLNVTNLSVLGNNVTAYPTFRNRLLNGCFRVWQRGTNFNPVTTTAQSGIYTADRWKANLDAAGGNIVIARNGFTAGQTEVPNNPLYYVGVMAQSFDTGTRLRFEQRIEDVSSFSGEVITLTFYAKVTTAGNINVSYTQNFGSGGSTSVTGVLSSAVALTTSWKKVTITTSIPSISGKTIGTSSYLAIEFNLPSAMGNYNYLYLASVQMESGANATPFEFRPIGNETSLCQRYYSNSFESGNVPGVSTANNDSMHCTSWADGNCPGFWFPVAMRVAPAITLRAQGSTTAGQVSVAGTAYSASATSISYTHCSYVTTGGPASGGNYVRFTWEAAAEL